MDTISARDPLSPVMDILMLTVTVIPMLTVMLTDTMDTITARDPLSLLPPPHPDTDTVVLMVMVIPMLTDTMDTISARDPLSPVMDILMLTVMVIPVLTDTMDTMPMVMASKFILLT